MPIRLSDFVDVILQVDKNSNTKVSAEYSIHNSISLSGSVDVKDESKAADSDSGLDKDSSIDTGVDLKFRFNFP